MTNCTKCGADLPPNHKLNKEVESSVEEIKSNYLIVSIKEWQDLKKKGLLMEVKEIKEEITKAKEEVKKGESWRKGYQAGYNEARKEVMGDIENEVKKLYSEAEKVKKFMYTKRGHKKKTMKRVTGAKIALETVLDILKSKGLSINTKDNG